MTVISQTLILCARVLRNLTRQPIWIAVMIVQPMFWLLLYSQLFRRIPAHDPEKNAVMIATPGVR